MSIQVLAQFYTDSPFPNSARRYSVLLLVRTPFLVSVLSLPLFFLCGSSFVDTAGEE